VPASSQFSGLGRALADWTARRTTSASASAHSSRARAELAGLAVEASETEVEGGQRLAMMLVGVGAGAGPGGEPASLPVAGDAQDLGPARGAVEAGEGGRPGAAQRPVPGARVQVEVAGARGDRVVDVADRVRRHAADQRETSDGEDPSARPRGHGGQRGEQRGHVRVALLRVDRQPAAQRGLDALGHPRVAGRRAQLALDDVGGEVGQRLPSEGTLAVQGLPQGDAEAELVGARVDPGRHELLRGHVRGRAEQHAGDRDVDRRSTASGVGEHRGLVGPGERLVGGRAGDAEVEDASARDPGLEGDEHVVGLEVAERLNS
jgi:hypothetical protein